MAEQQTCEVECAECKETFHVRLSPSGAGSGGDAEVVATCLYCSHDVMITVPDKFVAEDHLLRSKSVRAN